jgi:hypothetical protein
MLNGKAGRHQAITAQHIFPVIKTQNNLEILKGDKRIKGTFPYPGSVFHRYRIKQRCGQVTYQSAQFLGISKKIFLSKYMMLPGINPQGGELLLPHKKYNIF